MFEVRITFADQETMNKLIAIKDKLADKTPLMTGIGEIIRKSIDTNFAVEGRYSIRGGWEGGTSNWKPLTPFTIERRSRLGFLPIRILHETGRLRRSFNSGADAIFNVTGNTVTIGTETPYASSHQFGRNNMTDRPFVVVQKEDLEAIKILIDKYSVNNI